MSPRRRRPHRMPTLLVLGLVFAALASRQMTGPPQVALGDEPANPELNARAETSAWFCPGGTADPNGIAEVTVHIGNLGDKPSVVTLTTAPTAGAPVSRDYEVAARSRVDVTLSTLGAAPFVAATVEARGGEVVVDQSVHATLGDDISPCATSISKRWSIATASTARDDGFYLLLYNPFSEPAVAGVTVTKEPLSPAGSTLDVVNPGAMSSISVAPRSLVMVNVGDSVRRQSELALTVTTGRGRLVVGRVQAYNGELRRGLLAGPAVAAPRSNWIFPANISSASSVEVLHLYNPHNELESVIEVFSVLDTGLVDPQVFRVPAGGHLVVNVNEAKRIPLDMPHTLVARLIDGPLFVAERVLLRPGDALIGSHGTPQTVRAWALGTVGSTPGAQLALVNLSATAKATVTITGVSGGVEAKIGTVELPVGGRAVFTNPALAAAVASSIKVTSDEPIAVERIVNGPTGPVSLAPAVPAAETP